MFSESQKSLYQSDYERSEQFYSMLMKLVLSELRMSGDSLFDHRRHSVVMPC